MVRRLTIALPWVLALIIGLTIAVVSAPIMISLLDWYRAWDDKHNPPATISWHSVERIDRHSLRVRMFVTRHEDCAMFRSAGYTGPTLQLMQPADVFEREDGFAPQNYPVGIRVISRPWILRGIYGDKLAVSTYYVCEDRVVKTPLLVGDVPSFVP